MKLHIHLQVRLTNSVLALVPALFIAQQAAVAAPVFTVVNNATIQPGGPRTGTNGKVFFNTEGPANGTFADFGVVDFQTAPGNTFTSGEALSLTLTQSNASFTTNGSLAFYLSTNTTTNIDPGTSPLVYQASAAPAGIGTQLATTYLLGTGNFVEVADGHADSFTFTPTGAALTYLTNEIGAAGIVRLLMAPNDTNVSATYAGFSNISTPGPSLALVPAAAAVPEPATVWLSTAALLSALCWKRRSKLRP